MLLTTIILPAIYSMGRHNAAVCPLVNPKNLQVLCADLIMAILGSRISFDLPVVPEEY
jgi:hypothetical protein